MQPPFSAHQIRGFLFLAICLTVVGLSVTILLPFLSAILWATTLSVLTFPWFEKSRKRYQAIRESGATGLKGWTARAGDSVAAVKSVLLTMLVICLPFVLLGSLAFSQVGPALNDMQGTTGFEMTDRIDQVLHPIAEKIGIHDFHVKQWWIENSDEVVKNLREPAGSFAKRAGATLFTMIIALLSMFFFQRDARSLKAPFLDFCGLPPEKGEEILVKVQKTIRAVFSGSVIVAVIQGTIMGITYACLGVPAPALLGFISIVLCIVPLLGAPIIYIPVGLLFLAQGDLVKAAVVLGVGFLIVSQIDNVLKPYFISNQVSLHPLAIFFFVLGGISLFGPIGLMVGPMILTIFLALVDYTRGLLNLPEVHDSA
ncbi:MAG: AI-2E family transporter [Armatimonadetes bacterium]|nr:AI-2E family transporter [Armatimonadota bacterium]